ncbi:hypothetical protein BHE74_00020399 [Ensete ventricosum]|nr:hypothetical protein BHE74_00020399 [Ensete ventricosum]
MCPSTTEEASNMSLGEEGSYARRQQRQRKLRTATVMMEAAGDGVGDGGSFEPIPRRQMELHKKATAAEGAKHESNDGERSFKPVRQRRRELLTKVVMTNQRWVEQRRRVCG